MQATDNDNIDDEQRERVISQICHVRRPIAGSQAASVASKARTFELIRRLVASAWETDCKCHLSLKFTGSHKGRSNNADEV